MVPPPTPEHLTQYTAMGGVNRRHDSIWRGGHLLKYLFLFAFCQKKEKESNISVLIFESIGGVYMRDRSRGWQRLESSNQPYRNSCLLREGSDPSVQTWGFLRYRAGMQIPRLHYHGGKHSRRWWPLMELIAKLDPEMGVSCFPGTGNLGVEHSHDGGVNPKPRLAWMRGHEGPLDSCATRK